MAPNDTPEKKPGFFSRLFFRKKVAQPEPVEEVQAPPAPPPIVPPPPISSVPPPPLPSVRPLPPSPPSPPSPGGAAPRGDRTDRSDWTDRTEGRPSSSAPSGAAASSTAASSTVAPPPIQTAPVPRSSGGAAAVTAPPAQTAPAPRVPVSVPVAPPSPPVAPVKLEIKAPPPLKPPTPPSPPSFFQRLKERLFKTKASVIQKVRQAIRLSPRVDDNLLDEIEGILIQADVGPTTTERIVQRMKTLASARRPETPDQAVGLFKEVIEEIICKRTKTFEIDRDLKPYVVLVSGVNGTGKTTTIGKMARRCTRAGLKCMLIAGDTFRAAAIEQLEIWSQRSGALLAKGAEGSDPASICYEGLQRARSEGVDVVFIDTAGRLHTKSNLMDELRKIRRVIQKVMPEAPHETLLVLDATTGQNAIQQTRIFQEAVQISGIIMTKLDGTAKGGVLIAIRDLFDIPITMIGIGEGEEDLRDFEPRQFVEALFSE